MSEKKKRRPRREFDASFKVDAVKLVQTGERPIRLIAKELDITETSLRGNRPTRHGWRICGESRRLAA